jgi:hypothetical protein
LELRRPDPRPAVVDGACGQFLAGSSLPVQRSGAERGPCVRWWSKSVRSWQELTLAGPGRRGSEPATARHLTANRQSPAQKTGRGSNQVNNSRVVANVHCVVEAVPPHCDSAKPTHRCSRNFFPGRFYRDCWTRRVELVTSGAFADPRQRPLTGRMQSKGRHLCRHPQ